MQVSTGPFEANSTSAIASSPSLFNQLQTQTHRQSQRSTSQSSGSVVTIKRPSSLSRVPSGNPNDDFDPQTLLPLRLDRDPMPTHEHRRRKSVAFERSTPESSRTASTDQNYHTSSGSGSGSGFVGTVNRWSHSTSSSVASLVNPRRNRSSSGAVLTSLVGQQHHQSPRRSANTIDASPRASPQRRNVTSAYSSPISSPERSKRQSRQDYTPDSLTALPPLHTTPALTDPNDTESPSNSSQTVPTPLATTYGHHDYFDDPLSAYGMAKQKRVITVRNPSAPVNVPPQPTRAAPVAGDPRPEMAERERSHHRHRASGSGSYGGHKKPKHKERTEKDKKTMLSKALQKANTAVLLDNAQNYEGALEAYGDACDLLTQVMERTSGEDDKRKLDAIRVTYSNRMEELRLLVHENRHSIEEKDLPARPMSDDVKSLPPAPVSPIERTLDSPPGDTLDPTSESNRAPRLSYRHNDRDSFFSRTMAAVENSTNFTGESDMYSRRPSIPSTGVAGSTNGHARDPSIHLPPPEHTKYIPRPLSPKRPTQRSPQSPDLKPQSEEAWQSPEKSRNGEASESTSWLDPIDESNSSCSASVHSRDSYHQGSRRKHLRDLSGETDPGFDEAFDAAVEAAYDEGLEPDLDSRRRQPAPHRQGKNHESVQVPASEIDEINAGPFQSAMVNTEQDDEEERLLDEMTNDFGNEFDFGVSSKSALPRQSDSSYNSRSTWQSSQVSSRDTAASSLATVAEDALGSRMSKAGAIRESAALPAPTAPPRSSLPKPPNADDRRTSVRNRRQSNAKQLKIETSVPPPVRRRASTFNTDRSPMLQDEVQDTADEQGRVGELLEPTPSDVAHEHILQSPPSLELSTVADDEENATYNHRPSYEVASADALEGSQPMLFKKNRSTMSLRDHTVLLASPDPEAFSSMATPMSSTFLSFAAARRSQSQNPLTSQRANFPSLAHMSYDSQVGGGIHLFDTFLSSAQSPRSPSQQAQPAGLEPCPEPFLLRPFWLMRALSSTIVHPRGGFLTDKLFVPREVWQTRGVKLKLVEDKVANCDLLTAALGRLSTVDTYDADAVKAELESFEEVMDRAQAALAKKLGGDVGPQGALGMFKDAPTANGASATGYNTSETTTGSDKGAKSNSGKSYLSSWRKLRNKSSGAPLSGNGMVSPPSLKVDGKDQHTIPSVPMTNFVPVERRGNKRQAQNLAFEGPNRDYMGSLARLFDGVQILGKSALF